LPQRIAFIASKHPQEHRMAHRLNHIFSIIATSVALGLSPMTHAAEAFAGLKMQTFDTAPTEKIDVAMWYPTLTPSQSAPLGPHRITAAMNAAALIGPHPLIVISHGTGGMNMNHHELAAGLAQSGFVVAALTHPGDNFKDRALLGKPAYFSERPRQVSRLLDALLADAAWKPLIDANRIGFVGHSAGGFTGAALIGATPSIANTVRHCATNFDDDAWFCNVSGSKEKAIEAARNADYIPAVPASADSRIKAAVLMAPVGAFFTEASLRAVKIPVRVYVAGRDDVLNPKFHAAYVARHIPGAETINIEAGGHFMMVSKMSLPASANGSDVNRDPPGFDRAPVIAGAAKKLPLWFIKVLP
jgi:predicted dienelactone hydrolase